MRKKLREAFDETDTDNSGALDYNELKVMLHKAGFKANDKTMEVSITCVKYYTEDISYQVHNGEQ